MSLISVDETEALVLSCYLNIDTGYRDSLDRHVRMLGKTLERNERKHTRRAVRRAVDGGEQIGVCVLDAHGS